MKATSSPTVRFLACSLLALGLFAALSARAATTVVQSDFTNDRTGWSNISYSTSGNPSFTALDNGNYAVALNNRGLQQNFTSTLGGNNLTTDFTFSVSFAQASSSTGGRTFYALITSPVASNTDTTPVSGYGFRIDTTNTGASSIRFMKVTSSTQTGWNALNPTGLSTPIAAVNTGWAAFDVAAPTLTSQFHSISMTWTASTGLMKFYLDGSSTAAFTYTDTSFNSFGELYLSGNSTGYVDSVLLTSAIPESSTYALGMGGVIILAAGLVRFRRKSKV